MKFKEIKRRGQAMVIWAVFVPMLICFIGVGIDLGWYYLTVSRLQNAADAAVLAGALNLVEQNKDKDLNDYYVSVLTTPPSDLEEYYRVSLVSKNGASYIKDIEKAQIAEGNAEAQTYANKNLSDTSTSGDVSDTWNGFSDEDGNKVDFSSALYAKILDVQREENGTPTNGLKYYEVVLTEKVNHLFLRGFEPMEAKVVAYALLKPHDKDLVTDISILEKIEVIANWEYQDNLGNYTGNWNHFQEDKIHYTMGNVFRNETINVQHSGGSRKDKSVTGKEYYKGDQPDSINIDIKQDFYFKTGSKNGIYADWDLGYDLPSGTTMTSIEKTRSGWDNTYGYDLRSHASINFNYAWTDRNLNDLKPDVLWTRIETDPIWSDKELLHKGSNQAELNSVRQFILNVHTSNTDTTTVTDENDKEHTVYTERPFAIFYMGPETYTENSTIRKSQPVILNLYKDWNAILYMPNSPVIINGNGHKLTGFVIAKEFVRLTEDSDYTNDGYMTVTDGANNTIFIKNSKMLTESEYQDAVEDYSPEEDANGIISVREKTYAYDYDKLYVDDLIKYRDDVTSLSDFSKVIFDSDNGYNTTKTFRVATVDLKTSTEINTNDTKYVKVLVGDNKEERYIEKTKLPYVRVRRNDKYIYAPIYDLKIKKPDSSNGASNGVRFVYDDTNADLETSDSRYIYLNLREKYEDDAKKLNKVSEGGCKYFTLKGSDTKYFIGDVEYWRDKTEAKLIDTYRKVTIKLTDGSTETRYIREDKTYSAEDYKQNGALYYMKVLPEGSSGKKADGTDVQNYVIVDNKGNVQTKALPAGSTRPTNDKEQPDDLGIGKRLKTTGKDQDYRMPGWEVVYYKRVFNLSEDSCYSYFQIKELQRVNYLYLNVNELEEEPQDRWKVDDMFFPTYRASWID